MGCFRCGGIVWVKATNIPGEPIIINMPFDLVESTSVGADLSMTTTINAKYHDGNTWHICECEQGSEESNE